MWDIGWRIRGIMWEMKYRIRKHFRRLRRRYYRWKLKRRLNELYPIRKHYYRNLEFLKDLLVKINNGVFVFEATIMRDIKNEIIRYILANFRDQIQVGYLVGAAHRGCVYVTYGDGWKLIESQLREIFGRGIIKWYIREYDWDYDPAPYDEVYVCCMYWSDDTYLKFYEMAKNRDFEGLKEDYYGLVELNFGNLRSHFPAPKIEKIADVIGKFDYIYNRWRVYGWRKYGSSYGERAIAKAIWYATPISETARLYIYNSHIVEWLLNWNEYKKLRRFLW